MRNRLIRLGLVIVTLATMLTGAESATAAASTAARKPVSAARAEDPFYTPPSGYQSASPGTVLRSRPVKLAAFAVLPQHVRAWQLLYRSNDAHGKPMAAVTTVLQPASGKPKALLSYQIAEDASAPQCAPSHTLPQGNKSGQLVNQAELLLIDAAVAQGFAVSVPDYEGPNAEFGAPRQPGYAALDGIRAAEAFTPLGLPGTATPTAAWGYSGGSLATGWLAQTQPSYAPELNMRGAAVGGFVTDLAATLRQINGGFGAGLIPSALPGVFKADPELKGFAYRHLTPAGKAMLDKAGSQCEVSNVIEYAFTDLNRYLTVPLDKFLRSPEVTKALAQLNLGGSAPTTPMYVYHAIHDELTPISSTDSTVKKYCAAGDSVQYTRDQLSEHASLLISGAGQALQWLNDRLTGAPAPHGCSTHTVLSSPLTPPGLTGTAKLALGAATGLLNQPLGPTKIR